jgi:hypothetical protein
MQPRTVTRPPTGALYQVPFMGAISPVHPVRFERQLPLNTFTLVNSAWTLAAGSPDGDVSESPQPAAAAHAHNMTASHAAAPDARVTSC